MVKKPSLKIVIPVYNEEKELEKSVIALSSYLEQYMTEFEYEIVVADNASTDSTLDIAKKLSNKYSFIKAFHLDQKGRGRAVKSVWKMNVADISAYMDVDLSSDLKHFFPLVNSILNGFDIAIGSRNMHGSRVYGRNLLRTITSKGYIFLIKLFFQVNFSDAQCGFKAVSREVIEKLLPHVEDDEWFFDTELLILAEKNGYKIFQEPVTWIDNPGSTVKVWKTAQGDLQGLKRLFLTRPWGNTLWKK